MQWSSCLHHLIFGAVFTCLWSIVFGQESHHLRKDGNMVVSIQNNDEEDSVARHKRVKLKDRRLEQNDNERDSRLEEQWLNELDNLVRNIEDWILAEVKKPRPCAWGLNITGEILDWRDVNNIAFPSFDSNYWITPIQIKDLASSTIKITGKKPSARYYSFQTYTLIDQLSSVVGALPDVDITLAADDTFTIMINNGEDTGDPEVNSLQGLPNGANAGIIVLMYRTYVAVPATSPSGGVNLPLISMTTRELSEELRDLIYCNVAEPIIEPAEPMEYNPIIQNPYPPKDGIAWFRSQGRYNGAFPNDDVGYLSSNFVQSVTGYVIVLRGKAPTFHNGVEENPQVRYWSWCKLSFPSTKTVSCLKDEDAFLDSEGRYVIVVAPKRPSGMGFDYLNYGPGPIGMVALRNMLPSPEFYNMSVQNIDSDDNDMDIHDKMGDFKPKGVYCPIATIEEQGVEACFL